VGPIQTAQVANADLAENSVYANNIFAGQIDASKMVTDLLFAEKTINVGESTSLNRIRLDANTIAAGTAGYSNPSAAIKSRIFIGSGTYNNSGTPFYADNLGRFSLKDKLQFDGTNLQIDANGSFGGLLTAGPTGQEIKIGLSAGGGTNHGIYFAATADFLYNSGNFRLGAGKITYNGTLLDGEHVIHSRNRERINAYFAFDIYFHKLKALKDVRAEPFLVTEDVDNRYSRLQDAIDKLNTKQIKLLELAVIIVALTKEKENLAVFYYLNTVDMVI
jgi:hypothetical protein